MLVDALLGGVLVAIGLAVILTIAGRSLATHTDGEKRLVAAWLADELLAMVVVEGPEKYPRVQEMSGEFTPPFDDFAFDLTIDGMGRDMPYRVAAEVAWGPRDRQRVIVETIIAERRGDDEDQPREPYEPVDRDARYWDEEYGDEEAAP
jgi:hypothetical protein